jgi:hypothetical protein
MQQDEEHPVGEDGWDSWDDELPKSFVRVKKRLRRVEVEAAPGSSAAGRAGFDGG